MEPSYVLEKLRERANANPNLLRIGRYCTTDFLIEVGDEAFNLSVRGGRVVDISQASLPLRPWTFAIRAPSWSWQRFWQPIPEPGFHDVFAMSSTGAARIEGDVGPLLANLRYFKELLELPRRLV